MKTYRVYVQCVDDKGAVHEFAPGCYGVIQTEVLTAELAKQLRGSVLDAIRSYQKTGYVVVGGGIEVL